MHSSPGNYFNAPHSVLAWALLGYVLVIGVVNLIVIVTCFVQFLRGRRTWSRNIGMVRANYLAVIALVAWFLMFRSSLYAAFDMVMHVRLGWIFSWLTLVALYHALVAWIWNDHETPTRNGGYRLLGWLSFGFAVLLPLTIFQLCYVWFSLTPPLS